jgi:hypothetical protein
MVKQGTDEGIDHELFAWGLPPDGIEAHGVRGTVVLAHQSSPPPLVSMVRSRAERSCSICFWTRPARNDSQRKRLAFRTSSERVRSNVTSARRSR